LDASSDERIAARRGLLYSVHEFFIDRHADDAADNARQRRDWLHGLLSTVGPGDVVITLNWDTTAERTLGEMGLWNPTTGYGFEKPLALVRGVRLPNFEERPDPSQLRLIPSAIHVLKLHGSCGWHRRGAERFYFDHYQLLDWFGFVFEGEPFRFADPMHPDYDLDDPILLYPSFVKQLDDPHLLATWRAAHAALDTTDVLDVYGYSLPKADGAVRVLLAPVRQRSEAGTVRIHVRERMADAQARWLDLLGPSIQLSSLG